MAILSTGVSLLSVNGGGAAAMFNTVADMKMASLNNGDVVETAGFYSVNDGGACKYQIQATGTGNEMDLIALNNGLKAKALLIDSAYPEQIGYKTGDSSLDVVPYFQRIVQLNIRKIRLHAKSQFYYMLQPFVISSPDVEIVGSLGRFSGYSSNLNYKSSSTVPSADECMFRLEHRKIKFKDLYLANSSGKAVPCFYSKNRTGNHEGWEFRNLQIGHFDIGFYLDGDVNWQHIFERVTIAGTRIGLYTKDTFFMCNITDCYFACSEYDILSESQYNAVKFTNCNFACFNKCIRMDYWHEDPYLSQKPYSLSDVTFDNCSFEFDTKDTVPAGVNGCFFDVDDFVKCEIAFISCNFSLLKMQLGNVTNTRCISFGDKTQATFISCKGPAFQEYNENKHLFDVNGTPQKTIGSVKIINSKNLVRPLYNDVYLPTFSIDSESILFSNSTNILENYPSIKDGQTLFNLDDGCYYVKVGNTLVKSSNTPSNIVRVGNEVYSYVTIGNRKWITSNLKLPTANSKIWFKNSTYLKEEWGCYYPYSDMNEITAKLPAGWRIPTQSDFDDLLASVSGTAAQKAAALQSTKYPTIFTNATNTTGFSADPAGSFVDDLQQAIPDKSYFMGSVPNLALVVKNNSVVTYNYITDAPNLMPNVRICANV